MPDPIPTTPTPDPVTPPGNQAPPPPSNVPPAPPTPSADAVAALAAAEALVAANKADKDKAPPSMVPNAEEQRVAAEKLAAESAKALADKENAPLDIETWGSTGHEGGDAVLGLLQNAGVTPEEAKALLFDAVTAGDISKVDRVALEKKIGKDKTVLVLAGAKSFLDDKVARNAQIVADIKDVAGGEENWKKVAAWAKAGTIISDDQMADYIAMIDGGGAQARFAATELVAAYNADDKNTTLEAQGAAPVMEGDTSNTPGGRSLSRIEYAEEVAKLHQRGRLPTDAEMTSLSQARARGRAA